MDEATLRVNERFVSSEEAGQEEMRRLYAETRECCRGCCFEPGCGGCIPCAECIPKLVAIGWWTNDDAAIALAELAEMGG